MIELLNITNFPLLQDDHTLNKKEKAWYFSVMF